MSASGMESRFLREGSCVSPAPGEYGGSPARRKGAVKTLCLVSPRQRSGDIREHWPSGAGCGQSAAECGIVRALVGMMAVLERDDCSDRGLHEGVRERARELMHGFPAGAVRR
jgi:hypothetical protein